MTARAQGQHRHAEGIERIHAGLAKPKKLIEGQAELGREITEITLHHLARKGVVSGGHWRVSGENIRRRDQLKRGIKIEALLDAQPDPFEREERRMAFVHVKD